LKKIAIVTPCLLNGGISVNTINLARMLANVYLVEVVALESGCDYQLPVGVTYQTLTKVSGSASLLVKLLIAPHQALKARQLLKNRNYQLIISIAVRPGLIWGLVKPRRTKMLSSLRSYPSAHISGERLPLFIKTVRTALFRSYFKNLGLFNDKVICNSKLAVADLINNFNAEPERLGVIYNETDLDAVKTKAAEPVPGGYGAVFKNPVLISVGSPKKPKGQWHLIRIFGQVKKAVPGLKLMIVGDSELSNDLVALSKALGLKTFSGFNKELPENNAEYDVYFTGQQKNPYKFMARSTIYALTSLWEGFPNVLVEAMACGLPIISTDCRSGPRELLAPKTDPAHETLNPEFAEYGLLMPNFDHSYKPTVEPLDKTELIWRETLAGLLNDPPKHKGYVEKGFKRVEEFSWDKIAVEWKREIAELLTK
jgi:glycosyltransferase involved in cell wall biosynthesis